LRAAARYPTARNPDGRPGASLRPVSEALRGTAAAGRVALAATNKCLAKDNKSLGRQSD